MRTLLSEQLERAAFCAESADTSAKRSQYFAIIFSTQAISLSIISSTGILPWWLLQPLAVVLVYFAIHSIRFGKKMQREWLKCRQARLDLAHIIRQEA